jgi:hypothetical protein
VNSARRPVRLFFLGGCAFIAMVTLINAFVPRPAPAHAGDIDPFRTVYVLDWEF